jgi:hypothetical protein
MQLGNSFVPNLCCGRLLTSDAVMEFLKEKLPAQQLGQVPSAMI